MNLKINLVLPTIVGAVAVILLIFFFGSTIINPNSNTNTSFVSISFGGCGQCSAGVPSFVYGVLQNQGYSNQRVSLSFGGTDANKIVSNDLITSLPSVVVPSTSLSANILNALVYLNIFNLGSNEFVLNTPFLSGLTRNITYYSIIQNRTITSYDIFNVSAVYGGYSPSQLSSLVNPSELLLQLNASNLTVDNKTNVQIIYDGSPFSAIQSIILEDALSGFGNFTSLSTEWSRTVNISQSQSIGQDTLYNFVSMPYESPYFYVSAYNLSSVSDQTAQRELFQYDQNAVSSINSVYGSFTPFLDIGGRFIEVSSMLKPSVFSGLNTTQINYLLRNNATVRGVFNESVSFIDAALCSFSGVKSDVCNTSSVRNQELNIAKQI